MASEPGLFVSWFERCAGEKKRVKRREVTEENETSGSSTNNLDTRAETRASIRHTGWLPLQFYRHLAFVVIRFLLRPRQGCQVLRCDQRVCMSVCSSVRLSARISQNPHVKISRTFLYM